MQFTGTDNENTLQNLKVASIIKKLLTERGKRLSDSMTIDEFDDLLAETVRRQYI